MTDREAARRHHLLLAMASARAPFDPPDVFFAHGSELDWLETLARHTPITLGRRHFLRQQRAAGAIADRGERWEDFLVAHGFKRAAPERRAAA